MEGNKALSDIAHGDKRTMNDDNWEREKTGKKADSYSNVF